MTSFKNNLSRVSDHYYFSVLTTEYFSYAGASAYFFRHIFHDWPESDCVRILQKTVAAMNIYHSRILICDQVVDELSPSTASILYDIDMMTLFGGKERTLHQWETLLKAADQRLYISQVVKRMETTIIDVRVRVVG
jgi:hypothetical protein